jgi:NDP-sugar pyrophosphorylase family protein
MQAMIFAAGLGTRLRPLTNEKPKALVEIAGKTLLERAILKLVDAGVKDIIINIHHFGDKVLQFLSDTSLPQVNIQISDERELLLDTGGGLKKAASMFSKQNPVIVYNVDVITDIDLNEMMIVHKKEKALATLAVRSRSTSRYLLFNHTNQLKGWRNIKTQEQIVHCTDSSKLKEQAFSGIHIIEPKLFNYFPDKAVFSIIELYLEQASKQKIIGYNHDHSRWFDVGTPEKLQKAEQHLLHDRKKQE